MPAFRASRPAVPFALTLVLIACEGERTPSGPPPTVEPSALTVLAGDGQQGVAGGPLAEEIAVAAVAINGSPVPGVSIEFAVVSGGGQVGAQTVTTNAQGVARTGWTLGTAAADSQVVEARLQGIPAVRLRARVQPDAPASMVTAGGGAVAQVGAALTDSLSVTVKDRHGNPVAGVDVAWEVPAGGGSVSAPRTLTRLDGTSRVQWTLGPRVDSAQVAVVRVVGLDSVAFTANAVTAGVPLQLAKRGGDGQRGPAGGVLADSLGVTLRMPDGRPVRGAVVTWSVAPGAGTVTPAVSRTDAEGAAFAVWRVGTQTGLAQATATVDEGTLIFTTLVEAAAPVQIVAVSGGGEGPVAGVLADSLVVRVTDEHGNVVPGAEVVWAAVAGGGAVQPGSSVTNSQGIARAQWTLGPLVGEPGQSATAALAGVPPVAFQAVATTRGVPLQLARTGGDRQQGVVAQVLADSMAVQLRTQAGVPVQGATVAWAAVDGGSVSPATSRTDAQGHARAAWTLGTVAGPAGATATVDEGTLSFAATARSGPPAAMNAVNGDGQSATRGTFLPDNLEVRVNDAYGNPVYSARVRWSVLTGEGHLTDSVTSTSGDGTTRMRWAVGLQPGPNQARAAVAGLPPVTFTATGQPGVLVLSKVAPDHVIEGEYWEDYEYEGESFRASLVVSVKDEQGRPAFGATIRYITDEYSDDFVATGTDGIARFWWQDGVILNYPEYPMIVPSARFEEQVITFPIRDNTMGYATTTLTILEPGPYFASDSVLVTGEVTDSYGHDLSEAVLYVSSWGSGDPPFYFSQRDTVMLPLPSQIGNRDLTICMAQPSWYNTECGETTITIVPRP